MVDLANEMDIKDNIDWGLLIETTTKGVYTQEKKIAIQKPELITWLIEASLNTKENGSGTYQDLLNGANFFPYSISTVPAVTIINSSPRLELVRHSLDQEMIILKK